MIEFGYYHVVLVWERANGDPISTLEAQFPCLKWRRYPKGACLCQYTEIKLIRNKTHTCSGDCGKQDAAYAYVSDVQLQVYDADSHRVFKRLGSYLMSKGSNESIKTKAILLPIPDNEEIGYPEKQHYRYRRFDVKGVTALENGGCTMVALL
jgi:hypothetical protein